MISLDRCKHGWTTGSLSFSINFPHCSRSLDFLSKYASKDDLQPSSSFFSLLRNFAYFCTFFDQLTPDCFCVSRSYVIFSLKDLCDFFTFFVTEDDIAYFLLSRFFFFRKAFLCHCKIIFLYHFNSVLGVLCWSKMFLRSDFTLLESLAWSGNSTRKGKKTSKKDKRCR